MNTQIFGLILGVFLVVVMIFLVGLPTGVTKLSGVTESDSTRLAIEEIDVDDSGGTDLKQDVSQAVSASSDLVAPDNQQFDGRMSEFDVIVVSGWVRDLNGDPIDAVVVSDESNFGHVQTDDQGYYRIEIKLPRYKTPFLNFLRSGYRENRTGIPMDKLSAEGEVEVNVSLPRSDISTTVHGWVGNESGQGLANQAIELRTSSLQSTKAVFYAMISDEHGNFRFEGIRTDIDYRLDIQPTNEYAGFSLEPFKVSSDTPRLVLVLEELHLVSLEGMIVGRDNSPVSDFSLNIQNLTVDTPDQRFTSDASGYFKLDAVPAGEVKFSANAPEYFKITGLSIQPGDYQYLNLAIDRGLYHLTGWVSDVNGIPLGEARINLNSVFVVDDYHSYSYRSVLTDANGRFEFQRLGGGEYSISVFAPGYRTRVMKHRFRDYSEDIHLRLEIDDN